MRKVLLSLMIGLVATALVSAAPLCTDPSIIGVNLIGSGLSCELGGLTFTNFGASMTGPGAPAQIFLATGTGTDPWQTQTGVFGGIVNLFFQTNFNQFPSAFRDILFSFDITNASGIVGIDAWMGGAGTRNITETACADDGCLTHYAELLITQDNVQGYEALSGSASTLYIQKNISLFGADGSPATMSEFSQSFHTPEPMTFVLIGTGLLGLGVLGRRRARK